MKAEIWKIPGKNPASAYIYDGKIVCIIEESKINKDMFSKLTSVDFIKAVFGKKEYKIIELKDDSILRDLSHPYFGLEYTNNFIQGLVINEGLHYETYIHKPEDPRYSTPTQFFNRVVDLIKSGKRVGWFQGKWGVNTERDLNRCILSKRLFSMPIIVDTEMSQNNLFMEIVNKIGVPDISPLNAYNPKEAIDKLNNREMAVLVINNVIASRTKEDLEVKDSTRND